MRNSGKQEKNDVSKGISQKKLDRDNLDDDLNSLFRLPLAEFTDARNALALRLKKSGRGDDAVLVKALAKPPVSAWAVNQLYWNHREAFDRLIATGERFHKAQTSTAKVGDVRAALDARREALSNLTDLATSVLRDAGPNPSLDTIRRITTTLEAMSVYASRSDAPRPGRLTQDVDPPGFDSLASWMPPAGAALKKEPPRPVPSTAAAPTPKSGSAATNTTRKVAQKDGVRKLEEIRKANIAAAKISLRDATKSLNEIRARAQSLEAAKKKADADVKKAEKQRRDAEERLKKAKAASEEAAQRARSVAENIEEAASALDDAERRLDKASKELESLALNKR